MIRSADGAMVGRFFRSERPICPKCGKPLRPGLTASGWGSEYVTCDSKLPLEDRRCGQTSHLLAIAGIVAVVPLTKEQCTRFAAADAPACVVYVELGIVSAEDARRPGGGADRVL